MNIISEGSRRRHNFLEKTMADTEVVLKKIIEVNPNNTRIHRMAQQLLADLALFQVANVDSKGVHRLPNGGGSEDSLLLTAGNLREGKIMLSSRAIYKFHDRQMAVMRRVFGDFADDFQLAVRKKTDEPIPFECDEDNGTTANGYGDIGIAGLFFQMQPFVALDNSLADRGDYGKYVMTHELRHVKQYLSEPVLDISRSRDLDADMDQYVIGMEIKALKLEREAYKAMGETKYDRDIERLIKSAIAYRRRDPLRIRPVTQMSDILGGIVSAGSIFS